MSTIELATPPRPQSIETTPAKILHLINGEHFSGAERVQDLLALALPKFGYEVEFACLKPGKFPTARHSQSQLHELPMRSRFDWGCVNRLKQLLKEREISLIHTHTPRTLLMARLAIRQSRIPLVYHVHSPVGRDSNRRFSNWINTRLEKWSLKKATKIICVSQSLQRYMLSLGFPEDQLAVVQNGVAVTKQTRERPAPEKTWTIGTMALFRPRKGTEILLEALKLLQDQNAPVKLRAVGPFETPEYQKSVLDHVARLGIEDMIEWVGFQTDVNAQLRQMDLFVLPSLYGEGLPMVVLEAMANGVPVIASNVEGIPEAIRDGIDGRIFEPGNPRDLFLKINRMIGKRDRWLEMSRSCIERQQLKLSDISMAAGVAEVYRHILQP